MEAAAEEEWQAAAREDRPADMAVISHGVEPVAGEPVWCEADRGLVLAAVGRLPELVAEVLVRDDGRLNAGREDSDQRRPSGDVPPSPSPAADLADAAIRWARDEAEQLLDDLSGSPRGEAAEVAGKPATTGDLTESVSVLGRWWPRWLGDLEHGEQAGRAALRWERDLERATGQDLLVHRLPVRCPGCQAKALVREDGADQVDCARCGRSWPEGDYQRWVRELAEARRVALRERRREGRACPVS